ncbi:MAG: peptidylprolyl isomerase [Methylovulum sp.]|nr:peptidylprolyl isomerase [Methylovulum sp.]
MRHLYVYLLISISSLFIQPAISATLNLPPIVELQTNVGTITIKLDYAKAPISSNNFLTYVKNGFYKNTLIHRVINGFVVQGGGYNKWDGKPKTTSAPIVNESDNGLGNVTGTIAMARLKNPNSDSATSQFFINLNDNTGLDYASASSPGYAVFGQVIDGMDVVRKIENLATYSELPFTGSSGLVFIENAYSSNAFDTTVSKTRIILSGSGNVTSVPSGILCGISCYLSQPAAGTLKLTATPATGYLFTGWRGDCQGFNRVITVDTLKGNHNCTAVFSKSTSAIQ